MKREMIFDDNYFPKIATATNKSVLKDRYLYNAFY